MSTIGQRIRTRRIELGMTQEELAQKLGYTSRSSINKIEKEYRNLQQEKILDFANALATTPAYIMGWNESCASGSDLTADERDLLNAFRSFNQEGQTRILNYIEDLKAAGKYTDNAPSPFK